MAQAIEMQREAHHYPAYERLLQAKADLEQKNREYNNKVVEHNQEFALRQRTQADLDQKRRDYDNKAAEYNQAQTNFIQERNNYNTMVGRYNQEFQLRQGYENLFKENHAGKIQAEEKNAKLENERKEAEEMIIPFIEERISDLKEQNQTIIKKNSVLQKEITHRRKSSLEKNVIIEQLRVQLEDANKSIAQQSQNAAEEYMLVRKQFSPLRSRAAEVSPLRRELETKNALIEHLQKELAEKSAHQNQTFQLMLAAESKEESNNNALPVSALANDSNENTNTMLFGDFETPLIREHGERATQILERIRNK